MYFDPKFQGGQPFKKDYISTYKYTHHANSECLFSTSENLK